MFKRVMVAVVGLPLLILILGWAPSWATMLRPRFSFWWAAPRPT